MVSVPYLLAPTKFLCLYAVCTSLYLGILSRPTHVFKMLAVSFINQANDDNDRSTQPCMALVSTATPSCQLHVEWHAPTYPEALRRLGTDGHPGENTRVPHTLLALLSKLDPIHVRRSEARAFTKQIGRAPFSREIVVPLR